MSMTYVGDKPIQLPPFKVLLIYTHFIILSFTGETMEEAREKAIKVFKEQHPQGIIGYGKSATNNDNTFVTRSCYENEDTRHSESKVKALMIEVRSNHARD